MSEFHQGNLGSWTVEPFTIESGDIGAVMYGLKGRPIPPGTYWRLRHDQRGVIMSNTPSELRDMSELGYRLSPSTILTNRVLIHGLGLGCAVDLALSRGAMDIQVVEISDDVIELCGARFEGDPRVRIYKGDALTCPWHPGQKWNIVWHDIWDNICADNLPQMHRLHRRFGRRCDWQGSWCRAECEQQRR